jgi:dolichyl-phosphate beta-glucosyltransferase
MLFNTMDNHPLPHLSVVIPAYNEADRIGPTLRRVGDYLAGRREPSEIIVVDDGSTDRTPSVVEEVGGDIPVPFRSIVLPVNRGKGAAVRAGVLASRGDYVLFSDADLSTPIAEVEVLLDRLRADSADIVIGSRSVPGARITVAQGPHRRLAGKFFNFLVRLATGLPFHDTQCGFKLFRGPVARELFARMREERFAFDVEIVHRAVRQGLRVAEVPVEWADSSGSRVHFLRDSCRMALSLWRIRRARG